MFVCFCGFAAVVQSAVLGVGALDSSQVALTGACIQSACVDVCGLGELSGCRSRCCVVSLALPCLAWQPLSHALTSIYQDLIHLVRFVSHSALHDVAAAMQSHSRRYSLILGYSRVAGVQVSRGGNTAGVGVQSHCVLAGPWQWVLCVRAALTCGAGLSCRRPTSAACCVRKFV